ncbi:MAG: protein translocase subunit SecD, partial [Syntrophomonadaceae bacterium]|nr:protein translocase subunit SecD [Syntrophomonadaceae bacterium]
MNRGTGWIKLLLGLAAVLLLAAFSYRPLVEKVNLGLDLKGGVHVIFE